MVQRDDGAPPRRRRELDTPRPHSRSWSSESRTPGRNPGAGVRARVGPPQGRVAQRQSSALAKRRQEGRHLPRPPQARVSRDGSALIWRKDRIRFPGGLRKGADGPRPALHMVTAVQIEWTPGRGPGDRRFESARSPLGLGDLFADRFGLLRRPGFLLGSGEVGNPRVITHHPLVAD